jgi:hypothetical protein
MACSTESLVKSTLHLLGNWKQEPCNIYIVRIYIIISRQIQNVNVQKKKRKEFWIDIGYLIRYRKLKLSPFCHLHRQIVNVHLQSFIPRSQRIDLPLDCLHFGQHSYVLFNHDKLSIRSECIPLRSSCEAKISLS